jgi:hypothetical protein
MGYVTNYAEIVLATIRLWEYILHEIKNINVQLANFCNLQFLTVVLDRQKHSQNRVVTPSHSCLLLSLEQDVLYNTKRNSHHSLLP